MLWNLLLVKLCQKRCHLANKCLTSFSLPVMPIMAGDAAKHTPTPELFLHR